ncbi:hypothetical protein [uncultured Herbaspirillum sp.]|uniref:hypothetical protein n=1 Tax=uncultured Herbaspirillum sp. TaxID=160236 RepID=UPI002588B4FB|nr:hypothetical protein [uncultured Herbaspirillum sp.]
MQLYNFFRSGSRAGGCGLRHLGIFISGSVVGSLCGGWMMSMNLSMGLILAIAVLGRRVPARPLVPTAT